MKNILYVCPSAGVGGAETFIKNVYSHTDKSSYQNHFLLFSTGPLYDYLQKQGASVYLLPRKPRLSKLKDQALVRKKVRDIINEQNIDLVHSTMAYAAIFSAWATKQMNTKHIWFQHGPASGWMDRLAALLPHHGLISNSHYTSQTQRKLENPVRFLVPRQLPIEKILLSTAITPPNEDEKNNFYKKMLSEHPITDRTLILSMLCRIQEWKGVHVVIDALERLKTVDLKRPIHVFVWGEPFGDSTYFNALKEKAEKLKLPISFPGHCEDVSLALSNSQAVVNASIQPEPFGLSIIEGMMLKAVPIVPDEGGPIEIVSKGKDGLIFKARDHRNLADKIKLLANDCELREKLSHEAHQTALTKFKSERAIGHLEQFYQKVLKL